jgi:NDP-sugar pyrophosphorylase family protein
VVDDVPKPLAPVLGRPFLFYLLDRLALRGARSVTLCSGYMADFIQEKIGSEWMEMPVHHSVETEPMGTAGALALAKVFLQSERVLVMNGDTTGHWNGPRTAASFPSKKNPILPLPAASTPAFISFLKISWHPSALSLFRWRGRFCRRSRSSGA